MQVPAAPTEPAAALPSFLDSDPASPVLGEAGDKGAKKDNPQSYDFRNPLLLSAFELRKMKMHQEEFVQSLAARLSGHLRVEFNLALTGIQTITYQKLKTGWANPSHFTLFKTEPLRGVSVLDISYALGGCMVDRLMGGPGQTTAVPQEMSEIEKVLLEQTAQLILDEWCGHWVTVRELKPVILGYENNGIFIQTVPADAIMLVLTMDGGFGECKGQVTLALPFAALEPLIKRFCQSSETATVATPALPASAAPAASVPAPAAAKWNPCFNDVPVPVTAELNGLELTAREILALKVGDVLKLDEQHVEQINIRVADILKFQGRPGTIDGRWAVELTKVIKT